PRLLFVSPGSQGEVPLTVSFHCTKREATSVGQSFGWHLTMRVEDARTARSGSLSPATAADETPVGSVCKRRSQVRRVGKRALSISKGRKERISGVSCSMTVKNSRTVSKWRTIIITTALRNKRPEPSLTVAPALGYNAAGASQ